MALLSRIYFNAVFGGLGGLLGWLLLGVFCDKSADQSHLMQQILLRGSIIGGSIGYFVVSVEALRDYSLVRFARLATYGVLLGAFGGALGVLIGDQVNYALIGPEEADRQRATVLLYNVIARGLGWMLLGSAIGLSEGIAARSLGKLSYGTLGGTLGGLVGGALFGLAYQLTPDRGAAAAIFGAIGYIILGASIGSLSAFVQGVFQPASVKVMRGWQEGREYPLDRDASVLGRDEHADIALFRDMRIEKRHAIVQREGQRFILKNNHAPADFTLVNGERVPSFCELHDGDRIQLGNVILRFQTRAAKTSGQRSGVRGQGSRVRG